VVVDDDRSGKYNKQYNTATNKYDVGPFVKVNRNQEILRLKYKELTHTVYNKTSIITIILIT
jgi:hypothetical protein